MEFPLQLKKKEFLDRKNTQNRESNTMNPYVPNPSLTNYHYTAIVLLALSPNLDFQVI